MDMAPMRHTMECSSHIEQGFDRHVGAGREKNDGIIIVIAYECSCRNRGSR